MKVIYALTFALVLTLGTSCSKDDDTLDTSITGKWKLEEVLSMMNDYDYSSNGIFYHFTTDGTLTITSDIEMEPWMYQPGDYEYQFEQSDTSGDKNYLLKGSLIIEHVEEPCNVASDKMTFGAPFIDGPVYILIRH